MFDRFSSKYIPEPNSGCWLWTAFIAPNNGYGRFGVAAGRCEQAHRVSWKLHCSEPIPAGMRVCHSCDTPSCVNPDHLFLGTQGDNCVDRDKKNRQARGERIGLAKLTPEAVKEIRAGGMSDRKFAVKFGVSHVAVQAARSGRTWKGLT